MKAVTLFMSGAIMWALAAIALAHPPTRYQYFSDSELTPFHERIWFWTEDTLWGDIRSNDYISLKYSPIFHGRVITSAPDFIYWQPGHIVFDHEPEFNAPPLRLPETLPHLRQKATLAVSAEVCERYLPRVHISANEGVNIYLHPRGTPYDPTSFEGASLWASIEHPNRHILFFDGDIDVDGILAGTLTIYATGDILLVDDVKYFGGNRWGDFPEDQFPHMLALVADGDIVIADNFRNGRENGVARAPGDMNRHSIVINGSLLTLGGRFTFEHQNDDWELYQGPTPDERGTIYLKGAVTQWRRGYVHRSNHGTGQRDGTGYGKSYHYDFRFDRRPPPFYLEAMDENGHGLFDIISWGEQ